MFGEYLSHLLQYSARDVDLACEILQHRNRPPANRAHDQIYMLAGSQLQQAKLVGSYLAGKRVVFMGDGDCMSLLVAHLGTAKLIPQPKHITVLDFDRRLLGFIGSMRKAVGWDEDLFECHEYNAKDPVSASLKGLGDIFYTNPPYGFYNGGLSARVFLARSMELCARRSQGIAILPYNYQHTESQLAMTATQQFMYQNGYIISEMVLGQHRYDLDDRPKLLSGTIVFDRVEDKTAGFANRALTEEEERHFYGRTSARIPSYIGPDGTAVYLPKTSEEG